MKATAVLLPLLSITSILFLWAPKEIDAPHAHMAYRVVNATLQVTQVCFFHWNCDQNSLTLLGN